MAFTRYFTQTFGLRVRSPWTLVSTLEDILAALALNSGVANSNEAYFLDYKQSGFLKINCIICP